MARPDLDTYFLKMARVVATRATCVRRQVGCVLVDARGRTLSTGYNGPPSGEPHCTEHPCLGAGAPRGEGLDLCAAVHAEANALLTCYDIWAIKVCYVTHSPCLGCVKLLRNTSCQRVVFREEYAHDDLAKARWLNYTNKDLELNNRLREWIHAG